MQILLAIPACLPVSLPDREFWRGGIKAIPHPENIKVHYKARLQILLAIPFCFPFFLKTSGKRHKGRNKPEILNFQRTIEQDGIFL